MAGTTPAARAHDFILKPMETQVTKGKPLHVQLMLTESYFKGDHVPAVDQVKVSLVDPTSGAKTTIPVSPDDAEKALVGSVDAPGSRTLMVIAERAGRYRSR